MISHRSRVPGFSPGLLDGNPPPRWGAPGEDQVDCTVQSSSVGHLEMHPLIFWEV